jgi:hypothetical protein
LTILLPEEVSRQIAEAELAGHQARVGPCWRVALAGFKLDDQFSERTAVNDWRERLRVGGPAGHGKDSVDLTAASQGTDCHSRSSAT